MNLATAVTLLVLLTITQAASAFPFQIQDAASSPSNPAPAPKHSNCTAKQRAGFDWTELASVSSFYSYGGLNFSAFSTSAGVPGGTGSKGEAKCIEAKLHRSNDNDNDNTQATILSNQRQEPFTIKSYNMSTFVPADVDMVYTRPDGSNCTHSVPASPASKIVENDHCGSAVAVSFRLPARGRWRNSLLDVYRIEFDC